MVSPEDANFAEAPVAPVDMLIGCGLPEAHRVIDQLLGNRKEPLATCRLSAGYYFGPLVYIGQLRTAINFAGSSEGKTGEDSRWPYVSKFQHVADDQ